MVEMLGFDRQLEPDPEPELTDYTLHYDVWLHASDLCQDRELLQSDLETLKDAMVQAIAIHSRIYGPVTVVTLKLKEVIPS